MNTVRAALLPLALILSASGCKSHFDQGAEAARKADQLVQAAGAMRKKDGSAAILKYVEAEKLYHEAGSAFSRAASENYKEYVRTGGGDDFEEMNRTSYRAHANGDLAAVARLTLEADLAQEKGNEAAAISKLKQALGELGKASRRTDPAGPFPILPEEKTRRLSGSLRRRIQKLEGPSPGRPPPDSSR